VNIATVPRHPEWVDRIIEEGTAVLRARRKVPFNKPNDFGIMTPDKLIGNFKAITGGITLAMIFISSIALLVGGVGVMNIMLVSVTERTREIGIRKAIGAVRRDIVQQFLTEAMTLSGIGGIDRRVRRIGHRRNRARADAAADDDAALVDHRRAGGVDLDRPVLRDLSRVQSREARSGRSAALRVRTQLSSRA
jgi:hypothetical protein